MIRDVEKGEEKRRNFALLRVYVYVCGWVYVLEQILRHEWQKSGIWKRRYHHFPGRHIWINSVKKRESGCNILLEQKFLSVFEMVVFESTTISLLLFPTPSPKSNIMLLLISMFIVCCAICLTILKIEFANIYHKSKRDKLNISGGKSKWQNRRWCFITENRWKQRYVLRR